MAARTVGAVSEQRSVIAIRRAVPEKRNLKKVPFVELFGGRLQGVVSSGSDAARVYVSFIEGGSTDFYCSTNNNRRCGGLSGRPCKHIGELVKNATLQFGAERVAHALGCADDLPDDGDATWLISQITGTITAEPAAEVFSRFLSYLTFVDLDGAAAPIPEMAWFTTG